MLRSLDITPLFTTPVEQRPAGFYSQWRPYFYSSLDPSQFIVDSVELETKYILSAQGVSGDGLEASAPRKKGSGRKSSGQVSKSKGRKPKSQNLSTATSAVVTFDKQSVVYWLSQAKDILVASGGALTPALVTKMVELLKSAYDRSLESRERAQLAYTMRTLGYVPEPEEDGGPEVYAVLMEFDSGSGPTMVYASSDSFACTYWHRDARKWSRFDRGEGTETASRLCKVARELLGRFESASNERAEEGALPLLPTSETFIFTVVTSVGIKSISVDKVLVSDVGFSGLYNGFSSLFRILVGKDFDHSRYGTSLFVGGVDVDSYPLKLESLKSSSRFASISARFGAFLFDGLLFVSIFAAFYYFMAPMVNNWGLLPATVVYILFAASMPIILAWMESSPEWGHATIGKKIFGIHVHGTQSPHLSFPQTLARNMSKYILGSAFMFSGYFWGVFHPYRRCWHDLLSDTLVFSGPFKLDLLETFKPDGTLRNDVVDAVSEGEKRKQSPDKQGVGKQSDLEVSIEEG
jgi:uncharacterized RDD family membrane protein YckC